MFIRSTLKRRRASGGYYGGYEVRGEVTRFSIKWVIWQGSRCAIMVYDKVTRNGAVTVTDSFEPGDECLITDYDGNVMFEYQQGALQ